MISFSPATWDDGFLPILVDAFHAKEDAWELAAKVEAGGALVLVAKDDDGDVAGIIVTSIWENHLVVEAVSGSAGVMRAAIAWSKAMCVELGLKGAMARTFKPGVVYHMARAGARLNAAYLSWEP